MDRPKLANCSPEEVLTLFKKLGGFEILRDGAKHYGIKHIRTGKKTTLPRKTPVNRHLLKNGIIEKFLTEDLGYAEEEIYKYLWC